MEVPKAPCHNQGGDEDRSEDDVDNGHNEHHGVHEAFHAGKGRAGKEEGAEAV